MSQEKKKKKIWGVFTKFCAKMVEIYKISLKIAGRNPNKKLDFKTCIAHLRPRDLDTFGYLEYENSIHNYGL